MLLVACMLGAVWFAKLAFGAGEQVKISSGIIEGSVRDGVSASKASPSLSRRSATCAGARRNPSGHGVA
jgi:hypothetical protein